MHIELLNCILEQEDGRKKKPTNDRYLTQKNTVMTQLVNYLDEMVAKEFTGQHDIQLNKIRIDISSIQNCHWFKLSYCDISIKDIE